MKSSAVLRADLEAALGDRFTAQLQWAERPAPVCVPTSIKEVDALTGGLPRGSITEIHGPASSGRTSLLGAILAAATTRGEVCAVADAGDTFDPASAAAAGADLSRLLWVQCGGRPEHALKTADLLIQNGGFGLVVLDLADVPAKITRHIPLASWFRFRRAIENTPAVMVVVEQEQTLKSCASLTLEMHRTGAQWSGARGGSARLLRGAKLEASAPNVRTMHTMRKPAGALQAAFDVRAAG